MMVRRDAKERPTTGDQLAGWHRKHAVNAFCRRRCSTTRPAGRLLPKIELNKVTVTIAQRGTTEI